MEGYNKVLLVGNATDDPQQFTTKTGKPVAAFSLAVNRVWKDAEGQYKSGVDFHRIVSFGKWAEYVLGHVKKGNGLLVEGRMANRSFEDKEGKRQYRTEVQLQKLKFLSATKRSLKNKDASESAEITPEIGVEEVKV